MIDSLAIDLVALSKEHHVEIVKDTGFPKKLILSVDDEKMRQVLQNLLSNAVKYSHPDGFVSVGYRAEAGKGIISIKDTGLGIPESEQHHAFEKFFRGTNVQGKATDGTGLGLYIAREILRKMGGDLRFESEENVGTTFYASIPLV
jgi:signal transduction histidine kinase